MAAAQKPMVRDDRPAKSNTERTSLPRLSVPSGCCQDVGCSAGEPRSIGPFEANQGANADSAEITTRMISPMPPKRVRNSRRSRSSDADARERRSAGGTDISTLGSAGIALALRRGDANSGIEPGVEQIVFYVYDDHREGDQD